VLDASYVILGTRAVRATIDFRIYARVLLKIARKREREREREKEKEREREEEEEKKTKEEKKFIFGVALYSIAREGIPEVWLHATPLLMTLM